MTQIAPCQSLFVEKTKLALRAFAGVGVGMALSTASAGQAREPFSPLLGEDAGMLWMAAAMMCVYWGWQGAPFLRWPVATALFGAAATAALVIASHHNGEGPSLQQKMVDVMLTWLVLVPVAYAVGVGAAKARDMWRSR
ncbi:MAG: hypothetical protein KGK16_00225 [Bradyrhizobium sp.]|nr:hypothetical protein [Bradyrhizobium sp.]MDE2329201.1 hypothetical protein [Bradyrhizobium sp.]